MRTLISITALLLLSTSAVLSKDGSFASVVLHENDGALRISLGRRQWIKITNFTQNGGSAFATVSVFQGAEGLPGVNVLTASNPTDTKVAHEDVFIGGPVIIYVSPVAQATVFLTYQRGSD